MAIELTGANLRLKYRSHKPRSRYKADYNGNTGVNRHKHVLLPMVHGIKRKTFARSYLNLRKKR